MDVYAVIIKTTYSATYYSLYEQAEGAVPMVLIYPMDDPRFESCALAYDKKLKGLPAQYFRLDGLGMDRNYYFASWLVKRTPVDRVIFLSGFYPEIYPS